MRRPMPAPCPRPRVALRRLPTAVLLALLLLAPGAAADIVRLLDGTLLHGEITDFDEASGFTLLRVDNGGRVRLRWEHLPPAEVERIKASRGFTGEEPRPFLVNVVHLLMKNGTTETGVLVDGGPADAYTLRRRNGTDSFPRAYVRSVETGRADGQEIFAPDELYAELVAELGAPATAAQHFAVAVACEGAGLYQHALEHYEAVQQLDPALKKELIAARLPRIRIKIEDRVETAALDTIRNRLSKNEFDAALALVAEFRGQFPASRQLGDLAALEGQVSQRRRDHYGARVISDYHSFLGKTLNEIARRDGMSLGAAMEVLDSSLHAGVVDRLAAAYHMTPEGIEELWKQRQGGSVRTSSYGTGTFILGEKKALNWVGAEEPADEPPAAATPGQDDLQKRIEEALKKREEEAKKRAAKSASEKDLSAGLTADEWWAGNSTDDRVRWLTSYYAEFSGHLVVLRAKPRNCRICNATGYIDGLNEKGEVIQVTCTTCKGLKVERLVNYR